MRYFEVLDPYYALLKAEDKERALLEYNASVAHLDDTDKIYEVPENYALIKFSQVTGEDKKLVDPKIVVKDLEDDKIYLLVIDGSLL